MIESLVLHAYLMVTTPKDTMKYQYVHRQQYDTSCGLSSTSSVLDLYWGVPITEEKLVDRFLDGSNPKPVSIKDISQLLSEHGIESQAFRMDYGELMAAARDFVPSIVHYSYPTPHFVVLLSASSDGVIVADPARGTQFLSRGAFEQRWSGVALLTASRIRDLNLMIIDQARDDKQRRLELLFRRARFIRNVHS